MATGKGDPALANFGVVAILKGLDEFISLAALAASRSPHGIGTQSKANIFRDRAREEKNILLNRRRFANAAIPYSLRRNYRHQLETEPGALTS
ncbi:MAG: hypothetical protein R2867_24435 [Caldilineaceae bacterium]